MQCNFPVLLQGTGKSWFVTKEMPVPCYCSLYDRIRVIFFKESTYEEVEEHVEGLAWAAWVSSKEIFNN
jgi:hypothetical protein